MYDIYLWSEGEYNYKVALRANIQVKVPLSTSGLVVTVSSLL